MNDKGNTSDPLGVMMASGTVLGVCLLKKGEIIHENFPCSAPSLVKICRVVDGLTKECLNQGRNIDQMAFGYDGGNLLAVTIDEHRILIMHLMSDEIDFLATTARAHLKDTIYPPDPTKNGIDLSSHSKLADNDDSRVVLLTEQEESFDAYANKLSSGLSVEGLVRCFAS